MRHGAGRERYRCHGDIHATGRIDIDGVLGQRSDCDGPIRAADESYTHHCSNLLREKTYVFGDDMTRYEMSVTKN